MGWLERGHEFPTGTVARDDYQRLADALAVHFALISFPGLHTCDLCTKRAMGSHNLLLPSRDRVIAVPELILHYIGDHQYLPPPELFTALKRCPPIGSEQYLAALDSAGLRRKLSR